MLELVQIPIHSIKYCRQKFDCKILTAKNCYELLWQYTYQNIDTMKAKAWSKKLRPSRKMKKNRIFFWIYFLIFLDIFWFLQHTKIWIFYVKKSKKKSPKKIFAIFFDGRSLYLFKKCLMNQNILLISKFVILQI